MRLSGARKSQQRARRSGAVDGRRCDRRRSCSAQPRRAHGRTHPRRHHRRRGGADRQAGRRRHRLRVRPGLRLGRRLAGLRRTTPRRGTTSARSPTTATTSPTRTLTTTPTVSSRSAAHSTLSGNFYVTDDNTLGDSTSQVSEFYPTGNQIATFATGLQNPMSIAFDNQGNMYVGQQLTPYIAEFAPDGTRLADIGPLTTRASPLASTASTCRATSAPSTTPPRAPSIFSYNKCTNTQGPTFNQVPFPRPRRPGGDQDNQPSRSGSCPTATCWSPTRAAVLELDPNGNVIQTYSCTSMPGCGGQLFAVSIDPSGTSFWTGDSVSGNIYQINIAIGRRHADDHAEHRGRSSASRSTTSSRWPLHRRPWPRRQPR